MKVNMDPATMILAIATAVYILWVAQNQEPKQAPQQQPAIQEERR